MVGLLIIISIIVIVISNKKCIKDDEVGCEMKLLRVNHGRFMDGRGPKKITYRKHE